MDDGDCPYRVLGVTKTASAGDIKKAYRHLALKTHPDKDPSKGTIFAKISSAYDVLSDPEKRKQYDMSQKAGVKGFRSNQTYDDMEKNKTSSSSKSKASSKKPERQQIFSQKRASDTSYQTTVNVDGTRTTHKTKTVYTASGPQRMTSTKTTTPTKTLTNPYTATKKSPRRTVESNSASQTKVNASGVQSRSENLRTKQHKNGRIEIIKETITTYFDGRVEKSSESTFSDVPVTVKGSPAKGASRPTKATSSTKRSTVGSGKSYSSPSTTNKPRRLVYQRTAAIS